MKIDIGAIIQAVPALRPYLTGRAALVSCEVKAIDRDPDEPGAELKKTFERRLARMVSARFKRQYETLIREMERAGYKSIVAPNVYVPDDPEEYAEFVELFVQAILAGVDIFETASGVPVNDLLSGQTALNYARSYVTQWLAELDNTTQNAIREAVAMFIDTPGATLADVTRSISRYFGNDRAFRIAVTEVTRAFAQGNQQSGDILKAEYPTMTVYKRWFTNRDDRVCPICGPLDGKKVEIDETWESAGVTLDNPPAHPNCRCWTGTTIDV